MRKVGALMEARQTQAGREKRQTLKGGRGGRKAYLGYNGDSEIGRAPSRRRKERTWREGRKLDLATARETCKHFEELQ